MASTISEDHVIETVKNGLEQQKCVLRETLKNVRPYIDGPTRDTFRSGLYFALQCSLRSSTPKCPGHSFCANFMDTETF